MTPLSDRYESLRPLIVWLGLTELGWIAYWLLRLDHAPAGYTAAVAGWIAATLGWLAFAIYAGRRGFFLEHSRQLSNLVGVVIVLALAAAVFGILPAAREGLVQAASAATDAELASIHILRLLAIGTVIKYLQRQLPLHFVVLGSVPDALFAASAVFVTLHAGDGSLSRDFLVAWHAVGFTLFLGAGVSMFFTMPSPLRIYRSEPDASLVFTFPMLLAPNFTVPLFMLAHAFALVKLLGQG